VSEITYHKRISGVFASVTLAQRRHPHHLEDAVMKANLTGNWASAAFKRVTWTLGLLLSLVTFGSALADIATPEQRRACTPDVYRLCAGEIPNVRAITACLRRQKGNLSDACRAVFEQ
jgi:hypothetical protein